MSVFQKPSRCNKYHIQKYVEPGSSVGIVIKLWAGCPGNQDYKGSLNRSISVDVRFTVSVAGDS